MLLDLLNKLEELDAGGTSTPPIEQAQENIQDAITDVTKAAVDAPNAAMEELLVSVKDVLGGVQAELKRANDLAEKAIPTSAPDVEVPAPETPKRTVRRNGRKIVRNG